jgi:hypothetical protein
MAYLQISPLGDSREEIWWGQGVRKCSVSWNLTKLSQFWQCNGGLGPSATQNHLWVYEKFLSGALRSQHIARAGNCRGITQASGALCASVFSAAHVRQSWSMSPATLFISQCTGSHSAGIYCATQNSSDHRWFCVVLGLKPLFHNHNWLSFGKFQDTEPFLIPCPRHVSSQLPPSGATCNYVMAPITRTNLERFSFYWYAPFCWVYLGCWAAEFRNSGRTMNYPVQNL